MKTTLPLRLEIASRLLAARMVSAIPGSHNTESVILSEKLEQEYKDIFEEVSK